MANFGNSGWPIYQIEKAWIEDQTAQVVHVKTLQRLEETLQTFDFEIIYRRGNEMLLDFSNHQFVNLIQIDNRQHFGNGNRH
jgi:hypothetical protein